MIKTDHEKEIAEGRRFAFGGNWQRFLAVVDESRIAEAIQSLSTSLNLKDLLNLEFLDMGCGSGLFSLAARRLGAKVLSIDYDPQSVACARELKRRYCPNDNLWCVQEGSVLDEDYMLSLGTYDIVYSWGVLHHTGNMLKAFKNIALSVKDDGLLYISIYNDQGGYSKFWTKVKRTYCTNRLGRYGMTLFFIPLFTLINAGIGVIRYGNPFKIFFMHKNKRGMSMYYDWIDWLGGYPFEVANPETIFSFFHSSGFCLEYLKTTQRLGCNEFVFKKNRSFK